jgi:hypothetical protein
MEKALQRMMEKSEQKAVYFIIFIIGLGLAVILWIIFLNID